MAIVRAPGCAVTRDPVERREGVVHGCPARLGRRAGVAVVHDLLHEELARRVREHSLRLDLDLLDCDIATSVCARAWPWVVEPFRCRDVDFNSDSP